MIPPHIDLYSEDFAHMLDRAYQRWRDRMTEFNGGDASIPMTARELLHELRND